MVFLDERINSFSYVLLYAIRGFVTGLGLTHRNLRSIPPKVTYGNSHANYIFSEQFEEIVGFCVKQKRAV